MKQKIELDDCPPYLRVAASIADGSMKITTFLDRLPWFKNAPSWTGWRAFLCAVYGLPMTDQEYEFFVRYTGRKDPPKQKAKEVWTPTGRRGRKALALDTLIPTPTGFTTMADIKVGDLVFDENGKPTRVVGATNVMFGRPCYEVIFEDKTRVVADASHLWRVYRRPGKRPERTKAPKSSLVETETISKAAVGKWAKESQYCLPMPAPVECPEAELLLDPYVLGAWLGDGHSSDGRFFSNDPEIVEHFKTAGFEPHKNASPYEYGTYGLLDRLRAIGVLGNKHIPAVYMRASVKQRLDLLRGLMDTDGACDTRGRATFSQSNERLADQVAELAASLSFKVRRGSRIPKINGKECARSYEVRMGGYGYAMNPFRLKRKAARVIFRNQHLRWRYIIACRPIESVPVKCISVENTSGMYLVTKQFIPTHNTALGALIGVWEGLQNWTKYMAPGERAQIPMLGKNKEDAEQLRNFAVAILSAEALKPFVEGEPKVQEINLVTRVDLKIRAVSITAGRSRSVPLALLDEQAFWPAEDSAIPDEEVVNGIRPAQAHLPGAMIVGLSSPYAKRGLMWKAYREHWGIDNDPILVWKAPTLAMHDTPMLRVSVAEAYEKDPDSAKAEYGAEFRNDVVDFVPEEIVRACVVNGRAVVPPVRGINYWAASDPSGGTSDSMTLAIAHWSRDRVIVDFVQEWMAPFDPGVVVSEQSAILKEYGIHQLCGDRYAGEWPAARFREHKINYYPSPSPKSEVYISFLPILTTRTVELLDSERLVTQLTGLERKMSRGGRDMVDHRWGSHDDVVNVVALASTLANMTQRALPRDKPVEMTTAQEFQQKFRAYSLPKKKSRWPNIYRRTA